MRDFNKPLRKAVYQLLNGQLTFDVADVPVFDQKVKKGQDNMYYVIISTISSTDNSTFSSWSRKMSIVLDVVTKTADTVTTNIADNISEQVLGLMMPTVQQNGLAQANFEYINCQLDTDRYLDLQLTQTMAMVRRLLTFSLTVNQIS